MMEPEIQALRLLATRYEKHLEAEGFAPDVVRGYPQHLRAFTAFLALLDVSGVAEVTADHIGQYQLHLYEIRRKDGEPLSLSTQRQRLKVVRHFFRWLQRRGLVLRDPTEEMKFPRVGRRLPRNVLTVGEARKLLEQPDADTPLGLRDRAMLELLYSTGLRNGEARRLRVGDVDCERGEVRVINGKGRKDRVVPMGSVAAAYVRRYAAEVRPGFLARGGEAVDFLFTRRTGKGLLAQDLQRMVTRYAGLAGIEKPVTPHGLRHACATHMLKGRAGIRHIQEQLGHRSLATTQMYTHVEIGDLKREHRRSHPRERAR